MSGGGGIDVARRRAERAAALAAQHGRESDVFLTEHSGHGHALARAAIARGASTVVAWGGDGTVNEVGSAVAHTGSRLAIVPSGSGNGLARELGIPCDPERALEIAFGHATRAIDAGELDGRLFFNVAGVGLDALVAGRFADAGARGRGFTRYVGMTLRELMRYQPLTYDVVTDHGQDRVRALMVAIANSRQYGNGALIAPGARIDDGRLDVVIVAARPVVTALWHMPRLLTGRIEATPGVVVRTTAHVAITSEGPMAYHVDGEPRGAGASLTARVRPAALTVAVPG